MGRLRSGNRIRPATPAEEVQEEVQERVQEEVQEEAPVEVYYPVWVAISLGGGVFRHWALFVEDNENNRSGFIVNVEGSAGRFRYEQRRSNAHRSRGLIEVIQVGHVHQDNVKQLRFTPRNVTIRNDDPTWNCQSFIWDLLEELAAAEILERDEIYTSGRATVWSRMEGLA